MEKRRSVTISLDNIDYGTEQQNRIWEEVKRITLPEGITQKSVCGDILKIAWPSIIELLLTQLTSMVDLMMVGKLGHQALSAVGLTMQPIFLLIAVGIALNVGATALIARSKGEGNQKKANDILKQAVIAMVLLSALMAVLGVVFARNLVVFMGAKEDTVVDATIYMQIRAVGLFFSSVTASVTASLRGVGESKTPMVYNLIANVVNVLFNYILIFGHFGFPKMGVAGAALATDIGMFIAMCIAFYCVMSRKKAGYLHLDLKGFAFDRVILAGIVSIGAPAMFEQLVMRLGSVIFSITVANLGTLEYATHQVCMNIQALSFMIGQAFAVSATSLVGQSLGKKRADMARYYAVMTTILGIIFSIGLGMVFFLFGKEIVFLYNDEAKVVETGGVLMRFVAFLLPFQSIAFIMSGGLRGAGDTKAVALITGTVVLVFRTGLALIFVNIFGLGLYGAWYALAVEDTLWAFFMILRYRSHKWMHMKTGKEKK